MKNYYEDGEITIRAMKKEDPQVFYDTYRSYGWQKDIETYEKYFEEQEDGTRKVFIAEWEGAVVGLCTLALKGSEGPWAGMNHPEIVDLSVFPFARNKGIGNKLLDAAEHEASLLSDMVYLAVGVHSGYGAAQRIYVKRGYNFDGSGVWYGGRQLDQYAPCVNDDDLLLFMSKGL